MTEMMIEDASESSRTGEGLGGDPRQPQTTRLKKREVNGWLILDKPVGLTSTRAVAVAKRLFNAKKAGHAGTLDPLASGLLPIAFGEATKTVPFVMDGRKGYRFTVSWGEERDTDDSEGAVTASSDTRPSQAAVEAALAAFIGEILQTPPRFSAIKIGGERAYDLSRAGENVELQARQVRIERLAIIEHRSETSVFEAVCGKGTYVRAIARDLGRVLGCFGHVSALRRTQVGPFSEKDAISLDDLSELRHKAAAGEGNLAGELLPVATALDDIPALAVSRADAGRLRRGQSVLLRGRDAPLLQGRISVTSEGALVALAEAEGVEIRPTRIFNLGR
ncbi:MAG: tRNA pseudouridine(55) synthase TruB [Hyphomicrobiales bacterium]|nr:tRNA pseudouridine(55) synthase TruB [Hyphomicrobiales bacterium]